MAKAGEYNLRVTILPRVVGEKGPNAENGETWPGPGADYFAKRDTLSAGEIITQGIRQATGSMKLRVRGRAIPVTAADRLQIKATGELFDITGLWRDEEDTVILCDRLHQQTAGQ